MATSKPWCDRMAEGAEHEKLGKKAVLFIMTDDTKNCDAVTEYLETTFPEFKDAVLHPYQSQGEVSETGASKAKREELELLASNQRIDEWSSPFKQLSQFDEGGLGRSQCDDDCGSPSSNSKARILPEQTWAWSPKNAQDKKENTSTSARERLWTLWSQFSRKVSN